MGRHIIFAFLVITTSFGLRKSDMLDMDEESVEFAFKGEAGFDQENRMGSYLKTDQIVKGYPVFKLVNKVERKKQYFLFVAPDSRWRVGPDPTSYSGSVLKHPEKNAKLPPNHGWLYFGDGKWREEDSIYVLVSVKYVKGLSNEEGLGVEPIQGTDGYVEYYPGNMNLILSSPHGGSLKPSGFPSRKQDGPTSKWGGVNLKQDMRTKEIAIGVYKHLVEITGRRPHLIVNNLYRSHLDPNRDERVGTQGIDKSVTAYREYHNFIIDAKKAAVGKTSPFALLLDFHGQVHKKNSTELGYGPKKAQLNQSCNNCKAEETYIRSLIKRTGIPLLQMLHGPESLGGMFNDAGYKAVPSPDQEKPGDQTYYNGGYTVATHGSKDGGQVDAIQMEFPSELTTPNPRSIRDRFILSLAHMIQRFYLQFYDNEHVPHYFQ